MIDPRLFDTDDYNAIQEKYFADLKRQRLVDADPSGWLDTYSEAEPLLEDHRLPHRALARYFIDEGDALGECKDRICSLISDWDSSTVHPEEVTLCPSCGSASLITLAMLKEMGVGTILFETPAYFATIEQATILGIHFELIPTYPQDGYALPDLCRKIRNDPTTVVWLTQPRASLGFDQPHELIARLLRQIGSGGFMVIDEATDQSYPACLGARPVESRDRLIRLRSFTKGMGLNGFRMAAIIHGPRLRRKFTDAIEALGGSLDANSVYAVTHLAAKHSTFARMLSAANAQVTTLRANAERLVRGSPITVNRLRNGYIGSMVVDLSSLGSNDDNRRTRFLKWCRHVRTPVILGASMYAAKAPPTEMVRLNFFSLPDHITRGIANILRLWTES